MPHTEHVRCQFHLLASGELNRPLLEMDFIDKEPSALANPLKRIFFTFHESVTSDDAQILVDELNKKVRHMAVTEYEPGESM